jgi:hypothetical protein
MSKLGFHVDRTITIEGPFKSHDLKVDTRWVRATVITQGTTYQVTVLITAQSGELAFVGSGEGGKPTDEELEEARVLFAIIELAGRPAGDFQRPQPHVLPDIRVTVPMGPDSGPGYRGMWSVPSIRKHEVLRHYTVTRKESTWIATAKL